MMNKLQFYNVLSERIAKEITAKSGNWTKFLDTAANMYKYPFPDQLLIYGQRPHAIACAPIETWNERFGLIVQMGSKGIALIDDSGNFPRLKYVFDVADTQPGREGQKRPVHLWEMQAEHKPLVLHTLGGIYEDVGGNLSDSFRSIAKQLAQEYTQDNAREIRIRAEDSLLEEFEDFNLFARFEEALTVSISYTLMSRCGLDTSQHFDDEDFQCVLDFNTPDMVFSLGTASCELSGQVLRDVELTIKKHERAKAASLAAETERSAENEPSLNLHSGGGLPPAKPDPARAAPGTDRTAGDIRPDAESVPERPPGNDVQHHAAERDLVPAPAGDGASGNSEIGAGDEPPDREKQIQTAGQGDRPDGLDGHDERPERSSSGDGAERTDLRIESAPSDALSQLGTTSITETLSTSSITLDEVDAILRDGGNSKNSILRIAAHFAKNLSQEENAEFLKNEYLSGRWGHSPSAGGKGYQFGTKQVSMWFDDAGITVGTGKSALLARDFAVIPWEQAAERVNALYNAGQFVSHDILDEALHNERKERADDVIEIYKNMTRGISDVQWDIHKAMDKKQREIIEDSKREHRYLIRGLAELRETVAQALENSPTPEELMHLWEETVRLSEKIPQEWAFHQAHPKIDENMAELLSDKNQYTLILNKLREDIAAVADEGNVPIRFWRDPYRTMDLLEKSGNPAHGFPVAEIPTLNFMRFITEDEIDNFFAGRSDSNTRLGTLSFFLQEHTPKEREDFIKKRYKDSGSSHALGGADDSNYDGFRGKITLTRGNISEPYDKVELGWAAAVKRIDKLIREGRYVTRTECNQIPDYEEIILVRNIKNFYYNLPEEYQRPFAQELNFNDPKQAEKNAIRDFLDHPENIDTMLAQMKSIFENTPEDDRYYDTRKVGFESLTAFRNGTYTLFPGIDKLPVPNFGRQAQAPSRPAAPTFGQTPIIGEQFSMFSPLPILPSPEEQRAKIEQTEKPAEPTAEAEAPAVDLSADIDPDTVLTGISDGDKARLAEQFADNPRSREAVQLVREVYGDTLPVPLPQAIKRITELAGDGAFAVAEPQKQTLFDEYLQTKKDNQDAVLFFQAGAFYELYQGDAHIAADVLGVEVLSRTIDGIENVKCAGIPEHMLFDYTQKVFEAGHNVAISMVGDNGERSVTRVNVPVQTEPEIIEESPDLDQLKQTVYDRIMANEKFAYHLRFADNRGSLRKPLNDALDKVIADLKPDAPEGFYDDDIADDLFWFVYKKAWETKQAEQTKEPLEPPPVSEPPKVQEPAFEQVPMVVPTTPTAPNFIITDDHLGEGGAKTKFRNNIEAIQLLHDLEFEQRDAAPNEQEILSRYVGWGGIPQAFDPKNKQWTDEYLELNMLLSPEDWKLARASTLNAHYTTPVVIKAMYEAIERMGFKSGNILEPSCGVGNFFGLLPESMRMSKLYGVELDSISARIAKQLYPRANIQQTGFEKTDMPDAFFDLAIGNVPFGNYGLPDKRYDKHNFSIHNYFFGATRS